MPGTAAGRYLLLTVFLAGAAFGQPQSLLIPQIADGGGWQTTIVLTNTTTSVASASFNFYQETADAATQKWDLPLVETSAPSAQVPGGATMFLHTLGTSDTTSVGWGQLIVSPGLVGYAIFTQRITGRPEQDGTAPGGASVGRILVPYDNTAGFITAVALVNPLSSAQTISVNIETETGEVSQSSIPLPAMGHTSFALGDRIPATAGHRGLVEFYTTSVRGEGSVSMIALRFNPRGGFTTSPVYGQSGAPIVGVAPPSGGKK